VPIQIPIGAEDTSKV